MADQTDNTRQPAPFWWPDAQGFAMASIILIAAAALFIRMFKTSSADDKMLDTMITIIFSTCLVTVFQYTFGSSRGSAAKDDTQNRIVEKALATPPVVVAPVAPVEPPQAFNPQLTLKDGKVVRTVADALSFVSYQTPTTPESVAARDDVMKILANGGTDAQKAEAFTKWAAGQGLI